MPAVVAALAFKGDWGSAQVAAGIRQNVYALGANVADREIGWRVDAGASINLTSAITLLARAYYSDGFNAHSSLAVGDVVAVPPGVIGDNVEEWMVMVGLAVALRPDVTASVSAAYAEAEPGSIPAPFPASFLGTEVFQAVGTVFWTPVRNLELGVEVAYTDVDYGFLTGSLDGDAISVAFEATRKF